MSATLLPGRFGGTVLTIIPATRARALLRKGASIHAASALGDPTHVCAATGPAGAPGATTAADAAATAEEEEAGASSHKELSRFFPPLLWLLRDFVLELRDDKGASLSPDQYMERALESRAVGQRRADERNETRAAIRELSPRPRGGGGKARHDRMLMASNCLPLQVSSSRAARV